MQTRQRGDKVLLRIPERYGGTPEGYRKSVSHNIENSVINKILSFVGSVVTVARLYVGGSPACYLIEEFDRIAFYEDWFCDIQDSFEVADDKAFAEFIGGLV